MKTVNRPWGTYRVLHELGPEVKVKELDIAPGASLSMQRHRQRREIWFVAEGIATVSSINPNDLTPHSPIELQKFDMLQIDIEEWHQLQNNTNQPLRIVEIQFGENCVEEDIERRP